MKYRRAWGASPGYKQGLLWELSCAKLSSNDCIAMYLYSLDMLVVIIKICIRSCLPMLTYYIYVAEASWCNETINCHRTKSDIAIEKVPKQGQQACLRYGFTLSFLHWRPSPITAYVCCQPAWKLTGNLLKIMTGCGNRFPTST